MSTAGVAGGRAFGDSAGKSAGSRFGAAFKNAAKAGLIGLGALGVGAFKLAGDAVSAASDLEESTNKVRQVFGRGADDVFRFSQRAADALGQTNQQARDAAATFGLFGNIAGLTDRKSAKFATRMTRLASDLASFHNTEPEQAVEALGAALRGEAEPIRAFGVLLDEATLKAEAMSMGLLKPVKDKAKIQSYQVAILEGQKKYNDAVKEFGGDSLEALKAEANLGTARDRLKKATEGTIPALTQQQKVLAAQSAIFKQTEVAQGDFARTSDGLANQQRRLRARFEDAKAALGVGLLPIMTDAADFLLDKGIPAFEDFSAWFNDKGLPAIKDFGGKVKDAVGKVGDLVKKFEDLGALPALGLLAGGKFALGGGLGLGGKKGGVLGVGGAMRVFETNPAALGGGLGGGKKGGLALAITTARLTGGLSLYATGVAMFAKDVEEKTGVPKFGSRNNPLEPQILNPFEKNYDKSPGLRNDAFDKIRSDSIEAQTSIEQTQAKMKGLLGTIREVEKRDRLEVFVKALGLDGVINATNHWRDLLDDIDGRTVRVHYEGVQSKVAGQLDSRGGGVDSGESLRSMVNDNRINIERLEVRDIDDLERKAQSRRRARAGGGR